mgnify:CR=1 FL=1
MNHKYYKSKYIDRVRILVPPKGTQEMHRNTRIDFYSKEFEKKLKEDLNFKNLNRYPDVDLLYAKLAEFHNLSADNFLLTSGIDGGLKVVFEMCSEKGSNIVCLTPTYGMYHVYSEAFETNMIEVKSKRDTLTIDLNEVLESINDTVDIIFIVNPHEPIEHIFNLDDLTKIFKKAKQHDVLVFLDEAYYMFGSPTAINLITEYENLVVARTFSKGMGLPAIRLGYLISNKDFIKYLATKRFAHETNSITIDIAIWAIDNIDIMKNYAKDVSETRNWLKNELENLEYRTHGEKSNTILVDLKSKEMANYVTDKLKEKNIWVRGYLPTPVENYISVTMGSKELVQVFLKEFNHIIYTRS